MTVSINIRRAGFAAVAALLAGGLVGAQGVAQATPEMAAAANLRVENFQLADQHFLARQLYRMADAKAVVLFTYASGDATVKKDGPALMALKAA